MANRTFLIQADTGKPIPRKVEPQFALTAGRNRIPVYWYSLFDESCITTNEVTLHDGRVEQYPYLVTSVEESRNKLALRRTFFDRLLPDTCKTITEQWMQFVDEVELPFIHLDAAELWMMTGPDDFNVHLNRCLEAFEPPNIPSQLSESDRWLEMLDAAQIDIEDSRTLVGFKLAGHSWGGPRLPWE